jgi:hypothetical protein
MRSVHNGANLLLALALVACGQVTDDEPGGGAEGGAAGDAGVEAVGGSSAPVGGATNVGGLFGIGGSGGASSSNNGGGSFASGGVPLDPVGGVIEVGGAPSGGAHTGGGGVPFVPCESGTFDADYGAGTVCVPWADCLVGEFIRYAGTSSSNRFCAVCPEGTYSTATNSESCVRGGCGFGELVSVPGTPTAPASCVPDPDCDLLDGNFGTSIVAFSSHGNVAYALMDTSYVNSRATLYAYEDGTRTGARTLQLKTGDRIRAAATGPGGSAFLAVHDAGDAAISLWGWAPGGTTPWTVTTVTTKRDYALLAASDSHLIALAGFRYAYDPPKPDQFDFVKLTQAGAEKTSFSRGLSVDYVAWMGADANEGLWLSGWSGDTFRIVRLDSISAAEEIALEMPTGISESRLFPMAVAPDGRAYLCQQNGGNAEVIEFDPNGKKLRSWPIAMDGLELRVVAFDILPDAALYLAGEVVSSSVHVYPRSGTISIRVALVDGAIESKSVPGPAGEYSDRNYVTATDDGSEYLAGTYYGYANGQGQSPFVRKIF